MSKVWSRFGMFFLLRPILCILLFWVTASVAYAAVTHHDELAVSRANATNDVSRSGDAHRAVAGVENETTYDAEPLIFFGVDTDGTETFISAFAAAPMVFLTPLTTSDVATTSFTVHVKTETTTGFTYEVRQDNDTATSDVTATVPVRWVAFGWE